MGKYDHIDFTPPKNVADEAAKGLKYRQKANPSDRGGLTPAEAGEQGIGSGVQRAVNLKNRDEVSPETISKMVGFFARHEKNKAIAPEHKDDPWNDAGYVAWLLWGGDPGKTWAEKVKSQMDTADEKAKTASLWDDFDSFGDDAEPELTPEAEAVQAFEREAGGMSQVLVFDTKLSRDRRVIDMVGGSIHYISPHRAWFVFIDKPSSQATRLGARVFRSLVGRRNVPASLPALHQVPLWVGSSDGSVTKVDPPRKTAMQKESYADVISGREIIQKALRIGLLSREEARDRKVRDAAESIAHSVNDFHEEGHGFGSSDMNYAVKDMLNLAGLKADWVNGRLTRLASTSRAASDRMWSLHAALDTTDTALRGFILGELGFNQNKIAEAAPKQDKAKKKERDIPKNVKRYVEETKKQAPDKDPSYWWSVAWSRYCKYKKPGSPHCKMDTGEYFPGTGKKAEEAIPGGLARGKKPSDFDQKQLEMGIEVEKEHLVGDGYSEKEMHDKAQEIAMDHLFEIPDYYTRLQKMEGEAEMGKKAEKSEQTKCMDKYKDPDGTFLGPNDGTAWDNCIKAFKECRKDVDDPEAMCGYIRSRKAATILKSASSAKVAAQAMFKYTRHKGGSAEEALIAADYAVAVWNQKSAAGTLSRALDSLHGQLDGLMYNIPEGDEYEPLVKDMAAVRDHLAKIMSKHSRMLQSIKEK